MLRAFIHALSEMLTAFDRLHAYQYDAPWSDR